MPVIGFMFSPSGRFRRLDYWMHAIVNVVLWAVFFSVCVIKMRGLGDALKQMQTDHSAKLPPEFGSFMLIFFGFLIVMMISSFMSAIKRFHDLGNSGWNLLWLFVPFVQIWFAIKLMFFRGEEGDNQYGLSPYR